MTERHKADKILAESAWKRVLAKDSSLGERASAWAVTNAMKAKVKLGLGCGLSKRPKRSSLSEKKKRSLGLSFRQLVKKAKVAIKNANAKTAHEAIKLALRAVKSSGRKKTGRLPRVVPVQKQGGILPLIPIFAGLSALGAMAGGSAGIAKAVKDAQNAKEELKEQMRHNKSVETSIAMGRGLFMKPYKKGLGLYLSKN